MKKQAGFSLVMAIFILVVLSLLGGYMVKLSGVQHATSIFAIQGARAYQSARAGIGWAVSRIVKEGGDCSDIVSSLSFADINGFAVTLTCVAQSISEESDYTVYKITALSEFGVYSGANYISRKIEISIVD
jgi:MSHA biogenesis protein MshP